MESFLECPDGDLPRSLLNIIGSGVLVSRDEEGCGGDGVEERAAGYMPYVSCSSSL